MAVLILPLTVLLMCIDLLVDGDEVYICKVMCIGNGSVHSDL